jgi:alpha-D-ribose 1-methylphosphonate 5-triphosphate synthase subunit PhnG
MIDKSSYWRLGHGKRQGRNNTRARNSAPVDSLVARRVFQNRSRAIQIALHEKLERVEGSRLAAECAKLDRKFEQSLADEGLGVDAAAWPEF